MAAADGGTGRWPADSGAPGAPIEAGRGVAATAAVLAIAAPLLLAWNVAPSSTFLNQALALTGWGALLWLMLATSASTGGRWFRSEPGLAAAVVALVAPALATLASWGGGSLPSSLAWSTVGVIAAATGTLVAGAWLARQADAGPRGMAVLMEPLAIGMLVAGVLSAVVALIQVFLPGVADGTWIAASALPGRASGNLRQPNHLASLTLWAGIALVWLVERGRLQRAAGAALAALLIASVVLSFSRTGAVGMLLLAGWGLAGRGLSRGMRWTLGSMPLCYGIGWWIATHVTQATASGAARFSTQGDVSASRFRIWSDTLELIARHPWTGVGAGEFNFAWSLTPFPHRPVAFFDHTHNLPLQFAVELGLPLALLVTAALGYALWRLVARLRRPAGPAVDGQTAAMIVVMMAVHSLLEYPLWYAYFLLPTAFALGVGLGSPSTAASMAASGARAAGQRRLRPSRAGVPLQAGALLLMFAGAWSVVDYWKVVVIFVPPADAGPLAQRIEDGQRSVFFAHHAHYAAATSSPRPSEEMASFKVASHFLLDTRLMMAWAQAYHELGDEQRARHLAQRLREFHNPASKEYVEDPCVAAGVPWATLFPGAAEKAGLAPADGASPAAQGAASAAGGRPVAAPLPYQCVAPTRAMDYRDFR